MDYTDDFDDIKDAIDSVGRRDIKLKSKVTNERTSGIIDYNPSWESCSSGTVLSWLPGNKVWIYRDGEHYMDALQLVALEERIITRPTEYPSEGDFWKALERLRERGASIPRYTGKDADRLGLHSQTQDDAAKTAKKLKML